jgi:hypothetical protein
MTKLIQDTNAWWRIQRFKIKKVYMKILLTSMMHKLPESVIHVHICFGTYLLGKDRVQNKIQTITIHNPYQNRCRWPNHSVAPPELWRG